MKKNIFAAIFFSFLSVTAEAHSEVEISGELGLNASLWNLPTGERGKSAFGAPSLFLDIEAPLHRGNLLVVTLEGSEEKSSSAERFDIKAREAYVDLVSIFSGMSGLRLGLVPTTWQEAQYETWSYRFLGATAWAITEKWKYLNASDMGVSYMTELAAERGEFVFNMVNGEGSQEKEQGPGKEASVFFRFTPGSSWAWSLGYVYGDYDQYDLSVNKKERIQALATYQVDSEWVIGLEYLRAKDPADAVRDYKIAEGVDVTALTGSAVVAQAGSFFTVFGFGESGELVLRYDYLNAVAGEAGKDLKTALVAYGLQLSEDVKVALAVDHTQYGSDFAPGVRDRSKMELAAQVLF